MSNCPPIRAEAAGGIPNMTGVTYGLVLYKASGGNGVGGQVPLFWSPKVL